jgi:hypothetical protein
MTAAATPIIAAAASAGIHYSKLQDGPGRSGEPEGG